MRREEVVRVGVAVAPGVGPVGARRVRERFGGWEAAVEAARGGAEMPLRLRRAFERAAARGERVLAACRRAGVRVLLRGGPGWPERLECLSDPPEVLFARGDPGHLAERAVGIVGTRECSGEGAELARRIAERLAEAGWAVVSGLARGIDAAAHEGALAGGGVTIAVLGCGPERAYPPEHAALQERIAREGALVSEFAPGAPPLAGHFPRRNRVLAALSEGILVVESRLRGGALGTARHALDQGKEIFVVPGWPGSPLSAGPLRLLREGARAVRHAEDLLEDLEGIRGGPPVGSEEARALEAVREGASSPEELARALGVAPAEARERLARLELLGLCAPGGPRG